MTNSNRFISQTTEKFNKKKNNKKVIKKNNKKVAAGTYNHWSCLGGNFVNKRHHVKLRRVKLPQSDYGCGEQGVLKSGLKDETSFVGLTGLEPNGCPSTSLAWTLGCFAYQGKFWS